MQTPRALRFMEVWEIVECRRGRILNEEPLRSFGPRVFYHLMSQGKF